MWYLTFRDWFEILHSGRMVILRKLGFRFNFGKIKEYKLNLNYLEDLFWNSEKFGDSNIFF